MALNSKDIGRRIAKTIQARFTEPRIFWARVFEEVIEHIRLYMDLVEVIRLIHTSSTSYTIPDEDVFLLVQTVALGGPYTVFLPADPFEGQYVVIKDEGGNAGVGNEIVINRNGKLIDGASVNDEIDAAYGNQTYIYSGSQWMRLQEGVGGGGGGSGTAPTVEYFDITSSVDKSHILAAAPAGAVRCALNGVGLREGGGWDFTVAGSTVTITANQGVRAGDWLEVVYYT